MIRFLCPSPVLAMSEEHQCRLPADTMAADDVWWAACFGSCLCRERLLSAPSTSRPQLICQQEKHNALVRHLPGVVKADSCH